ncbi:hypothetical protein ABID21_000353 [Pseudorhizobium tarimense]|uniref:Uncharacterized protein n=1 Tax=Pseudorhizobium tarimense TaxID=1079109 RepID=A0ABV2H157_9HYPH|nr:plant virulence effector HPE1-like domain-containing protein [Pseudorhizobium tarimense]MCJ8517582.1 hypothetical protein [Pseudorhizobium tarimense]
MRFLLTSALILASCPTLASSLTLVITHGGNGSVVMKSCSDCPPLKPKDEASGYKVPVLEPGVQKTEVVEIGGEKKVLRTEAWLGGSPVVYVSKVHDWTFANSSMLASSSRDGIDRQALVGSVEADMSSAADPAQEPQALNLATMQLRLN